MLVMPLTLFFLAELLTCLSLFGAAVTTTEGKAATIDHTDIRGFVHMSRIRRELPRSKLRESRVFSCQ